MNWPYVEIGDLSDVVTKGTTPTTMGRPFTDSGVNFVKAEALNGDTNLDSSGFSFVDMDTHEILKRSILQEGDVLLTIAGANIGRCGLVREYHLPANTNQAVGIIRVNRNKTLPRYVYYFFKQQTTYNYIQSLGGGQAAQPNLNLANLKKLSIPLPPVSAQQRIVSILSAYDNLIENNNRRIALLEESARLLYREWFVHLRFPGHEHVKVIDGLPDGWEQVTVPDIIDFNPTEKLPRNKEIWYVPMASLSETGMTANRSSFELRTDHTTVKFRNGDVLLARITPCLENGKTGFVYFLDDDEVACGSTEFIVMRGKRVSPVFAYCLARSHDFREAAIKSMIGSSGRQRVQASCFREFWLPLAPSLLLQEFDRCVGDAFTQIRNLTLQNEKLTKARDLLLPRLMNGELAV
jgi:type I restriction enzyme S subunit